MGSYTFIAGHKDHNAQLYNVNEGIETRDELIDSLRNDVEEAYELFGDRWRVDFGEVYVDDIEKTNRYFDDDKEVLMMDEEDFDEISNDVLTEVEEKWKLNCK